MRKRDIITQNGRRATLNAGFTPNERERLLALRQDFAGKAEHSEWLFDAAEMEFARWLVEHGRMSEELSGELGGDSA